MRTAGVKALVREVLDTLPSPYSEHIIDDVLFAIETNPTWRRHYDVLCDALGKTVVNQWCGQWTGHALEKTGELSVPSRKNTLSDSYSLLDVDVEMPLRLPTNEEAREVMAAYYKENREHLPANIREHREEIIALIMEGVPVDKAFALALQKQRPGQQQGGD